MLHNLSQSRQIGCDYRQTTGLCFKRHQSKCFSCVCGWECKHIGAAICINRRRIIHATEKVCATINTQATSLLFVLRTQITITHNQQMRRRIKLRRCLQQISNTFERMCLIQSTQKENRRRVLRNRETRACRWARRIAIKINAKWKLDHTTRLTCHKRSDGR